MAAKITCASLLMACLIICATGQTYEPASPLQFHVKQEKTQCKKTVEDELFPSAEAKLAILPKANLFGDKGDSTIGGRPGLSELFERGLQSPISRMVYRSNRSACRGSMQLDEVVSIPTSLRPLTLQSGLRLDGFDFVKSSLLEQFRPQTNLTQRDRPAFASSFIAFNNTRFETVLDNLEYSLPSLTSQLNSTFFHKFENSIYNPAWASREYNLFASFNPVPFQRAMDSKFVNPVVLGSRYHLTNSFGQQTLRLDSIDFAPLIDPISWSPDDVSPIKFRFSFDYHNRDLLTLYNSQTPSTGQPVTGNARPKRTPKRAVASRRPTEDREPETSDAGFENVATVFKRVSQGEVVFQPSESMTVGEPQRIDIAISRKISETVAKEIGKGAEVRIEKITIGAVMKAQLRGDSFEIQSLTNELQEVQMNEAPEIETTRWAWNVTPTEAGSRTLTLTIDIRARIPEFSGEVASFQRVFDRQISVQVNRTYTLKKFLRSNWQYFLTALGGVISSVIAFFFGQYWKSRTGRRDNSNQRGWETVE